MLSRISLAILSILLVSCGPSEEFVQLQQDFDNAHSRIESLEGDLQQARMDISDLNVENQTLDDSLDEQKSLVFQYQQAIDGLICEKPLENMSYDEILESTSRLEAYVNGIEGVQYTSGGFRDTIYNNADSKIHAIRYYWEDGNQYIMTFLVFYDEFDWVPSTFFVDGQCWVDPPIRIP